MTDTDQLVVWLREAMDAAERRADRWHDVECDVHTTSLTDAAVLKSATLCDCGGPAAVLRRIAAGRKTLDEHRSDNGDCAVCADPLESSDDSEGNREWSRSAQYFPCTTVRLLAEGYGWTDTRSTANWPECMCTPSGECGNCWEKRQRAKTEEAR